MSGWHRIDHGELPPDRVPLWVFNLRRGAVVAYFDRQCGAASGGPLFEATTGNSLPLEYYTHWRRLEDPGAPGAGLAP